MRRRYLSVTIDSLTEANNFHDALAFGMINTAISPFCVLDQQTGECITRFYSHRRHTLEVKQPIPECDPMSILIENAAKECGVEVKFVKHFTDESNLLPHYKRYYIIQAFKSGYWKDVIFSHGDISTAEKKARHYRNQNDCETRVIAVKEKVSYSYEYEVVKETKNGN